MFCLSVWLPAFFSHHFPWVCLKLINIYFAILLTQLVKCKLSNYLMRPINLTGALHPLSESFAEVRKLTNSILDFYITRTIVVSIFAALEMDYQIFQSWKVNRLFFIENHHNLREMLIQLHFLSRFIQLDIVLHSCSSFISKPDFVMLLRTLSFS